MQSITIQFAVRVGLYFYLYIIFISVVYTLLTR